MLQRELMDFNRFLRHRTLLAEIHTVFQVSHKGHTLDYYPLFSNILFNESKI
ncbi:MAG: hypothetical protein QXT87_00560 [Thermoproteota archaeon]